MSTNNCEETQNDHKTNTGMQNNSKKMQNNLRYEIQP